MSLECKPCAKKFSGIVSYDQHMASEKHKRKESLNLLYNSNNAQQHTSISCNICNISFQSIEDYELHSKSSSHITNVNKKFQNVFDESNVGIISSSMPEDNVSHNYVQKKAAELFGDEPDAILSEPPSFGTFPSISFTECKLCNKHFSGSEPFKQHLMSLRHKKKVELENYISETGSQNITNLFSCEPCKKIFSGQIPLEQHLVSETHKKKIQNLQLLHQLKTNNERGTMECNSSLIDIKKSNIHEFTNIDHPWFCKICNIQCSGQIPYEQHINGDIHSKNKRKINFGENSAEMKNKPQTTEMISINVIDGNVISNPVLRKNNKINQETDFILPQVMHNMLVSSDEINIKEFLPDDKINFDINVENENENSKIKFGKSSMTDEIFKEESEVYDKCELCNKILKNKEDAKLHYESMEHYTRRWRPS